MFKKYTTAAEEEEDKAAVISDSEGEDNDDGIVENFDSSTLPPEIWANIINCEY